MSAPPMFTPTVDGAAVLDDVAAFIRRFVAMPAEHAMTAVVLWVAHCHTIAAAEATPFLSVQSAEKRSGKTRLLEVLELLVPEPLRTAGTSEAALFRSIAEDPPPVLLIDEVDAIFNPKAKADNEGLRGLLNAGHRRGATFLRCVVEGKTTRVERMPVFCARVLAGIGEPPDTIADRSVVIRMKRRAAAEPVERFRYRRVAPEASALRDRIAGWGEAAVSGLSDADPGLPDELDDRAQDAWEPLLAIADLVGGDWPGRARQAAVALSADRGTDQDSLGVRLLADVRTAFGDHDRMTSVQIVAALTALELAPWADMWGKPLDARRLARMLGQYDVRPAVMRMPDGRTPRGYRKADLEDSWARYCPPPTAAQTGPVPGMTPDDRNTRNNRMGKPIPGHGTSATRPPMLRTGNGQEPHGQADVADVAAQTPTPPAEPVIGDDDLDRWTRLATAGEA